MKFNIFNLTLTSIFLIALFFNIPAYHRWLWDSILVNNASISAQMHHMDEDERMQSRYGPSYFSYMHAAETFRKYPDQNAVLLLPPNSLLKQEKIPDFQCVEPAEFYYFTGYEAVWATSPNVEKATWAIYINNHRVMLGRIKGPAQRDSIIADYKKFNY